MSQTWTLKTKLWPNTVEQRPCLFFISLSESCWCFASAAPDPCRLCHRGGHGAQQPILLQRSRNLWAAPWWQSLLVNENQTLYDVQICPETREAHKYIGVAIHIFLHKSIRENAVEDISFVRRQRQRCKQMLLLASLKRCLSVFTRDRLSNLSKLVLATTEGHPFLGAQDSLVASASPLVWQEEPGSLGDLYNHAFRLGNFLESFL